MPHCLLQVRFNILFLSLCLKLPLIHLLQPLSLCGHVQLQSVEGSGHLAHGEFDRLLLKFHGVAVCLFEARRLVVLRSGWKTDKQTDGKRNKQRQTKPEEEWDWSCINSTG